MHHIKKREIALNKKHIAGLSYGWIVWMNGTNSVVIDFEDSSPVSQ